MDLRVFDAFKQKQFKEKNNNSLSRNEKITTLRRLQSNWYFAHLTKKNLELTYT
jgi:hypothetical protein